MGARDVVLIAMVVATSCVALGRPFFGLLGFLFFSIANPHSMAWAVSSTIQPIQPIAGATILGYLVSSERKRLPNHLGTYLLVALWGIFCLSTLTALYPEKAYKYFVQISKILLMVVLSMALMTTKDRLLAVARVIALSLGILGLKSGIFAILTGGQQMVWGPEDSFLYANNAIGLAL